MLLNCNRFNTIFRQEKRERHREGCRKVTSLCFFVPSSLVAHCSLTAMLALHPSSRCRKRALGTYCYRLWTTCTVISSRAAAGWVCPLQHSSTHKSSLPPWPVLLTTSTVNFSPAAFSQHIFSNIFSQNFGPFMKLHNRDNLGFNQIWLWEDLLYLEQTLFVLKIDPRSRTVKHRCQHTWQLNSYEY